jgi:hypothetical protein
MNVTRCEVVEVRNLADADGIPCPKIASKQCSDCGIELCGSHAETCLMCHDIFCPSCSYFHQTEHSKAAKSEHESQVRRTA